jgi:hypothetical protein
LYGWKWWLPRPRVCTDHHADMYRWSGIAKTKDMYMQYILCILYLHIYFGYCCVSSDVGLGDTTLWSVVNPLWWLGLIETCWRFTKWYFKLVCVPWLCLVAVIKSVTCHKKSANLLTWFLFSSSEGRLVLVFQ